MSILRIRDVKTGKMQEVLCLRGKKGEAGADGKDGVDGLSAYQIWLNAGNSGTEADFLASLKGEDGKDGKDGSEGTNGKDGVSATHSWNGTTLTITSASGTSSADLKGEKGDKGDTGAQGERGLQGEQGVQGEKGEPGEDGKDYILTDADKAEIASLATAVPAYWKGALDEGAKAINTALCEAGRNKSAFLFYTDAHWNVNHKRSPMLLKYLHNHTGMTKTFFGGDIVSEESTDPDVMRYLWEWRNAIKGLPNHHSVVGNHDDGNTTDNLYSEKYVYGYLLAPEETPDMVCGDGMYYYIDHAPERTRYIFLDTAYKGVDEQQREFLQQALIGTTEGWHIVVVAHVWYMPDYAQENVRPMPLKGLHPDAAIVTSMLDAYNSRTGVYAACGGWVEFCIGGHIHYDYDATTETGIPIICAETDSYGTRGTYGKAEGTVEEAAVSGIIADYDNHKIHVVRVGRGESREIAVTNYVIEYTNQIPISTDASGAVYNGKGFKENVRLSSSGADKLDSAATGIYATGFIPCTRSDTLYFKNCQIAVLGGTATKYQTITCYDSNKGYINARYVDMASQMNGKDYDVDGNGCLTRYNCEGEGLFANTAFVRITGNYIGADSIITVNQPIE